jgi:hypothetical protein
MLSFNHMIRRERVPRFCGLLSLTLIVGLFAACNQPAPPPAPVAAPAAQAAPAESPVERGKYLVTVGGCDDCHSPKVFKEQGPEPDMSRRLSGHPAADKLPKVPAFLIAPDRWGAIGTNDFTAWVGPWGTSFPANLTPDKATGLGSWTADMFVKALKTGKHQGERGPSDPPADAVAKLRSVEGGGPPRDLRVPSIAAADSECRAGSDSTRGRRCGATG